MDPAAVVDGNVYRVLRRCYFGIDIFSYQFNVQGKKSLLRWLNHSCLLRLLSNFSDTALILLLPITRHDGFPGAIQCAPNLQNVLICPLAETCEALRTGKGRGVAGEEQDTEGKNAISPYIYKV